jgi:hypothetical protein
MATPTAAEFLRTIFPPELMPPDERVLIAHPETYIKDGVEQHYYQQYYWHPRANPFAAEREWTYCVSTVREGDKPRRRNVDLVSAMVLVLDDILTKAAAPPVTPSYILETSPGNQQWGYLLDPFDVSEPSGRALYDACLVGLSKAGYNDPGCRGAARIVKVPGALHRTGFITQVVAWAPSRTWDLSELMAQMQVAPDPSAARRRGGTPSDKGLEEIRDPVLTWLTGEGRVFGISGSGYVTLRCPWEDSHTVPGVDGATGYSPLDFGYMGRNFNCKHGHCAERTTNDFLKWVMEAGGPALGVVGIDLGVAGGAA